MIAIDTNLIVRYLTGDHVSQSARARALIDAESVFVPITVLLEVEWVLRSAYGYRAADVVHALRAFAGLPTVTVEDGTTIAAALDLAETEMDFADALHLARSGHCEAFVTFDRKLVKAAKVAGHEGVREAR
ncbi:MAG: type II toxin-antitoxin system VapC family toxin [Bradyrhizobium sp.]|uniref:type II toxin-antitoxin system VapC family toxin n=1 Tax=Bradyrhizobium sp. TaxID=376 RepID=UPI001A255EBD|nr:type II toxin-antitoxin system VapC family toxin [Bradyrhizobium sp.]MBJ7406795.1 type II toxin-antitoxin system VapC family toxin [Bradyrhizobium sp.]